MTHSTEETKSGNLLSQFTYRTNYGTLWERVLAWPVLQGLGLFSSDMLTAYLSRASTQLGWAASDPEPSPPEPRPCRHYSHSQSSCAQCQQLTLRDGRGQFAQPADYPLRRPVDQLAVKYARLHKQNFIKLLEIQRWKRVCGARATQITTHVVLADSGISIRL